MISLVISGGLWYQLEELKSQLYITKIPLDTVNGEQYPALGRYSEFRQQINIRLGSGQDCQNFITPDDPAISAIVQEIAGGYSQDVFEYWDDSERLYRWVVENIEYTRDSYTPVLPEIMDETLKWGRDFWRMPSETLEDRAGDCEDMSTLLASMILNYTKSTVAVWCVGINVPSPEYKGHIAVVLLSENDKLAILDPADEYYTGCHSVWGLTYYDVKIATNAWLVHKGKDMPDAQVYIVFNNYLTYELSSTEDFIEWVREY